MASIPSPGRGVPGTPGKLMCVWTPFPGPSSRHNSPNPRQPSLSPRIQLSPTGHGAGTGKEIEPEKLAPASRL